MPIFRNPERERREQLERFRQSFLQLTADGSYPPHRQQRLFLACLKIGLDWDEAMRYVEPEAEAFLRNIVRQITADQRITPEEIAGLRRLQKRLKLPDSSPPLQKTYALVEQIITDRLGQNAAYLSSEALALTLRAEVASYALPPGHEQRLLALLERQHCLARLMAGQLPAVAPRTTLYEDELCHLEVSAQLLGGPQPLVGWLLATSQRLMLLAPAGGFAATWPQIRQLQLKDQLIYVFAPGASGFLHCNDPQYVATLLIAAHRRYIPAGLPAPPPQSRKLPPQ